MNIRIAKPEDLEKIVEIYNQTIIAGQKIAQITPVTAAERKEWFTQHTPDKYPIFVAEEDKLIIGYSFISPYRPGRMALRYTAEVGYFIHSDYQRKGIGSSLLKYAINMCPTLQIKTLFAVLIDTNIPSIKLLEKFGFEQWGHLPKVADFDGVEAGHLYYGLRIQNTVKIIYTLL